MLTAAVGECCKWPSARRLRKDRKQNPKQSLVAGDCDGKVCPTPAIRHAPGDRLSRVASCPSPSLSEVALLSHSPCSPSEREAGHEATRFHNFSRRRDGGLSWSSTSTPPRRSADGPALDPSPRRRSHRMRPSMCATHQSPRSARTAPTGRTLISSDTCATHNLTSCRAGAIHT
jgi:hypothetical protein